MQFLVNIWLILAFLGRLSEGKFAVELNDDFDQCSPGVPILSFNTSRLEFTPIESGTSMHISGDLVFMEDFVAPVEFKVWSLHLERGAWVPGAIERTERDLCSKLMSPLEQWFFITRHFHRKRCPYKAGHVETLPNIQVGSFGLDLPASFGGEWKLFLQMERRIQGRLVKQCLSLSASIVEI